MNRKINYDFIKKKSSAKLCCICFEDLQDIQNNLSITNCNHYFCTNCLIKTMKYNNKCPLCRNILRSPKKALIIDHTEISSVIEDELYYHSTYINEFTTYINDIITYYSINSDKIDKNKNYLHIHSEITKLLKYFGSGVSLSLNRIIYENTNEENNNYQQINTEVTERGISTIDEIISPRIISSSPDRIIQPSEQQMSTDDQYSEQFRNSVSINNGSSLHESQELFETEVSEDTNNYNQSTTLLPDIHQSRSANLQSILSSNNIHLPNIN